MESPRLFINYRATDTGPTASRLAEALSRMLQVGEVFIDHRNIEPGTPWPDELRKELARASVVFALIGDRWLASAGDGTGLRRIDFDGDWVREEILAALAADTTVVVPLFVESASPPAAAAFPRDPQMVEFVKLQGRDLRRKDWKADVEALLVLLAKHGFRRREGELPRPDAGPADVLATYRAYLRSVHSRLVPFFPEAASRTLDGVYVEVGLDLDDRAALARRLGAGAELSTEQHLARFVLGQERFRLAASPLRGVLESSVAEPGVHWVVLGDPGAGKSTIARHLTWELAGEPDGPIPVYLSLPAWHASGHHPFQLAERELCASSFDGAGLAKHLQLAASKPGRVWLLLDGLDEIAPRALPEVRRRILALAANLEDAVVCVLSRSIGYEDIGAAFLRATVRKLDPEAQRRLLATWLGEDRAEAVWDQIAARETLIDLAGNPLMLTLVARLELVRQRTDGSGPALPSNRLELYSQAIGHLLERGWGQPPKRVRAPDTARRLLQSLALELQASEGASWSRKQLDQALWSVRRGDEGLGFELKETWADNRAFLQDIAVNSGVLAARDGPNAAWTFLHRQFREFLAAEAIHESTRGWREIVGEVDEASVGRWSETLGFYCGMASKPLEVLAAIRDASPAAAVRTLGDVEGVEFGELLDFLFSIPNGRGDFGECTWDGVDLRRIVLAWRDSGSCRAERLRELLWERVGEDADTETLAWLHFTLEGLGEVDLDAFFKRAGRPRAEARIEFVTIPAGPFLMGSPENEEERYADEGPQHEVRVAEFALAATAVTNAQYQRFDPDYDPERWRGVSEAELASHPVVNVSWWEARLYSAWAGCRLPSEAEWEYACRAGTTTRFWSGDGEEDLGAVGWFGDNSGGRTHTVGELSRPNEFGLHDMHGNVWEWCEDAWHESYVGPPADGSAWLTGGSDDRVIRGGGWYHPARLCRSAYRFRGAPGSRSLNLGFRPARS